MIHIPWLPLSCLQPHAADSVTDSSCKWNSWHACTGFAEPSSSHSRREKNSIISSFPSNSNKMLKMGRGENTRLFVGKKIQKGCMRHENRGFINFARTVAWKTSGFTNKDWLIVRVFWESHQHLSALTVFGCMSLLWAFRTQNQLGQTKAINCFLSNHRDKICMLWFKVWYFSTCEFLIMWCL